MRSRSRLVIVTAAGAVVLTGVPAAQAGDPPPGKKGHARGQFEITEWIEDTDHELPAGGTLSTATTRQIFRGGIRGEGGSKSQKFTRSDGFAWVTGMVRVEGRLGGRSGTFVLQVKGRYDGAARSTWFVVPGSGTGQLAGLRGSGGHIATHEAWPYVTYTLNYHFE